MKVSELIKELSALPQDLQVVIDRTLIGEEEFRFQLLDQVEGIQMDDDHDYILLGGVMNEKDNVAIPEPSDN
jgi:hypothetical protein